jgi:hypothetical protein
VFAANGNNNTESSRADALAQLTECAREQGLRVQKSALAYRQGSRNCYYGTPDLVDYLATHGVSRWTHNIRV